jgi:two-component system chemotaxis response regulator CheB
MLGVVVAASTGGPPALTELLSRLGAFSNTAFFLVQHGPQWALEVLAQRLNNLTPLNVQIGVRGAKIEPNTMYVSPADVHMVIDAASWTIDLSSEPKENFVRPAADPLFRTAAKAFGPYLTGVVMTGMGRDGTKGAAEIAAVGGKLIAQDPKTCTVDSMPQTMISSGLDCSIVPLEQLADAITKQVREFEKVFRPGR